MKNRLLTLFLFVSLTTLSQIKYQGVVLNRQTNEPIPFCAIAFKGSSTGCLSNEEGIFQFVAFPNPDTLIFNCIGYQLKKVAFSEFQKNNRISLSVSTFNLDEVVIYDKDDFLYEIIARCKKNLIHSNENQSKVYFSLQSSIANQPVEFMECYYNSKFNASTIRSLDFKNGRVGLAPYYDRFFVNSDISKAFTFINLIGGNKNFPTNPFELNSKQLRKHFQLKLLTVSEGENEMWHIAFQAKNKNDSYFNGELWIEKETALLKQIILKIERTKKHPFLPLFEGAGKINEVSMQINKTYSGLNGRYLLDHIDFNYQLNYQHHHSGSLESLNPDSSFILSAKGVMYFYDLNQTFILPYFKYDEDLSDYRKITSLTYNQDFWSTNNGLEFSQSAKQALIYFKENGILLNFKNGQNNSTTKLLNKSGKFFEDNYLLWSAESRIFIKKNKIKNDTIQVNSLSQNKVISDLYQIKAQLFLDINPEKDSIQHYSASIFDIYQTYYNLPEEPVTNCFINIYFDLVEIERRKMETDFRSKKCSVSDYDALYKQHTNNLDNQSRIYFKEVERGKNKKALEKWNEYVYRNTGIDNLSVFQLK